MADWRRSMMPPPDFPVARTGIPMPSTAKKPTNNFRISLAGSTLRVPGPVPPGSNPRQSMMRSQNNNPLLASTSKQAYGRTPVHNSTRRGSMWQGGSSQPLPPSIQPLKDNRPLRDKPYQAKMRHDILSWLQDTGYEISMQVLTNITGKDFKAIFQHLVLVSDPNYQLDPSTRFEDEFVPTLKALSYPFASQIDNKWLAAPASMHSWPSLLGALHWLTEVGKQKDAHLDSGNPTLQIHEDIPEEFDSAEHHRTLAFEYYNMAYGTWLEGADDFDEANRFLEDRYDRKNEVVAQDVERNRAELDVITSEHKRLKSSTAPLEKLQKENGLFTTDTAKFQKILEQYEGRKKKLIDYTATEKADLASKGSHRDQLVSEQEKLAQIVKTQNLSPEEVIRMNTEHDNLARNLEDLKQKISETHKVVMNLEVVVTNRAAAAEETLDAYTNSLSSLELFPPLPEPWADVDLTLELNTASSQPNQLLFGADLRKIVKPTLSAIAESKRADRAEIESEQIKVENRFDQLILECENVDQEISEVEKKVNSLNEHADDLRDATQQGVLVTSNEVARLERELANARNAALANGMGAKSRLQALQLHYGEQVEKVNRLREETVRAIIKNSNDVGIFKGEVSQHLMALREFAERD